MKIVHVMLCGPVTDGWNYQDNLLTKYHRKSGHEVTIITSQWVWGSNGKLTKNNDTTYFNKDGVKMIRIQLFGRDDFNKKIKRYKNLYTTLINENANILFIHGCSIGDMNVIVKYLKLNPKVKVFVDNHSDFSNSATNFLSKNILHKIIWRTTAKMINPYAIKFFGVLPARVDFLVNVYGLPKNKCELLVMGGDDDLIESSSNPEINRKIRSKYGIRDDDFLIVTGGKIDQWKMQTLYLMEAVKNIKNPNVKLIVFGSVSEELKASVSKLCDEVIVQYIGWVESSDSYNFFASANLVVFPGRHSVFWEQVVAQGVPMLCKYWDGTTHIDIGGNVKFLMEDSMGEVQNAIEELIENPRVYEKMKNSANNDEKKSFLYSVIAENAIKV
ncbi:glycosyltransferase family 4 protein [Tannockella kyphosi]|uniref:glycosyltransferase family 4 protein n=1 Tax=Tannockella kyphosi TaxID=2899121 RepID=UPI0020127346|nr:glycosyltransferase family 4 protein [Tannockella kyphosi]